MNARIQFLVGYVGSAALVAFLATCLETPRVATFTCDTSSGQGEERCQLAQTPPAAPADDRDAAMERLADASTLDTLN